MEHTRRRFKETHEHVRRAHSLVELIRSDNIDNKYEAALNIIHEDICEIGNLVGIIEMTAFPMAICEEKHDDK